MNHVEFKSILFKSELEIAGEKYQSVISTTRDENRPEIEIKQSISLGKGEGEKMVVMKRVDRGGVVQMSGHAVGVNEDQIGTFSKDWLNTVTDAVFGNEEDELFYKEEQHMEDLPNEQDNYKEEVKNICDSESAIEESEDTVKQKVIDVDTAISKEMKEEHTMKKNKEGDIEWTEGDAKKSEIEEEADKENTEQVSSANNMQEKDGTEEALKQRAVDIDDYINKQMDEENTQNLENKGEEQKVSQDIEKYIQDTEKDLITEYEIDNADTLVEHIHNPECNPVIEDEDGHAADGNQDLMTQESDDCEMEDILFVAEMIKGQLQPFQDILQHYFPHFLIPQH